MNIRLIYFCIIVFFAFPLQCFTQEVFFDPQVKDFNLIHENGGEVVYEFRLMNFTNENYKVKGIITSCGCTQVDVSTDSLRKSGAIMVRAGYNPKGRPGYFFKQFTIVLQGKNKDTLAIDGYLKGNVLSVKDVEFNPVDFKNAVIQIKPVLIGTNTANEKSLFNTFMNDLTFVLDKDGFANVVLEYYQHMLSEEKLQEMNSKTRELVKDALTKRGYEPYRVGFAENKWRDENDTIEKFPFVVLKVSGYTNEQLKESKVLLKAMSLAAFKSTGKDSCIKRFEYVVPAKEIKINWTKDKGAAFVTNVVRTVLIYGYAKIGLYVEGINAVEQDKFLSENIDRYIKTFYAALGEQGINFDKVQVLPPVFLGKEKPEITFAVMEIIEKDESISWNSFQHHLDSIRQENASKINYEKAFKNNIPVYYQRIDNQDNFDTTSKQFKEWFNLLKSKWHDNKKLKLIVEATASNAPTIKEYDNAFVARRRLNSTIEALKMYFAKNGIDGSQKMFDKTFALVKGPLYNNRDFSLQQYKKFQYIKLIPVETDTLLLEPNGALPYQVNFNNNDFVLPSAGIIFRNFIDNLVPYIDKYGYVELIMESSASKVPPANYASNSALAFERLQKAKDAIINAVAERGFNPLRVIFAEERTLVQGPAFKAGMDSKNELFKTFQYIKIIPKTFIYK